MCGLVGVAGDITAKDEKVFKNLLVMDILRGEHSTGVAVVNKGTREVSVVKQVGNTFELFNDKRFDAAMQGWQQILIGHNRYATVGAVNKANAHPFEFSHVVGAHNGTLTSRYELLDSTKFVTDSEALYNHINEKGVVEAISKCRGAYALTWWDSKENTINFLRNKERSLYIATSESGNTLYWASEKWMLEGALTRNEVKFNAPVLLAENNWMSVVVDGGKLEKPRFRKVDPPKEYAQTQKSSHLGTGTSNMGGATKTTQLIPQTSSTKNNVTHGNFKGLMGCKAVLFELKSKQVDKSGATFFQCVDPTNRDYLVRLYVNKREEFEYEVGDLIQGDVNQWKEGYYKVSSTSVKLVEVPTDEEQKYEDQYGNMLTKKEWERKYKDCSWCSSPLDAGDNNIISKDGNVICPHCAADVEIRSYLKG